MNIPNRNDIEFNLKNLTSLQERYRYIMGLGKFLSQCPDLYNEVNKISGCQSQVWILLKQQNRKTIFYGDSDAIIVKGLIIVLFSFYQELTLQQIIKNKINPYINTIGLQQYFSITRIQGMAHMTHHIQKSAQLLIKCVLTELNR